MGQACSAPTDSAKVSPQNPLDTSDERLPDILRTEFTPPIQNVSPENPWLPLLTPHMLVEINAAFRKFDRDGDGHIEQHEVRTVMQNLGAPMSDDAIKKLIAGVDTDGNGMVEFDEFIGIMGARIVKDNAELEQAVNIFFSAGDDDGEPKGVVHVNDIVEIMTKMGSTPMSKDEVDNMIAALHPDEQGFVSRENFREAPFWNVEMPEQPVISRKRSDAGVEEGGRTGGSAVA